MEERFGHGEIKRRRGGASRVWFFGADEGKQSTGRREELYRASDYALGKKSRD